MYCQKCGTQNQDDANFCNKCGNGLLKTEEVKKEVTIVNKKSGWRWWHFVLILFAILVISQGGNDSNANNATPTKSVPSQEKSIQSPTPIQMAKFGDKVVVDNLAYTFNGMTTSTAIGEYLGSQFYGDKANGIYLILDVTIENVGKESDNILIGSNVKIVDDQGRKYEHDSTAESDLEIYLKQDTFMGIPQLQPGLPKRGKIVFDVPTNVNGRIELSGGLFSEKRYVSLPVGMEHPASAPTISPSSEYIAPSTVTPVPTTLINSNNILKINGTLNIGSGYTLKVLDIDSKGKPKTALFELDKNEDKVDLVALQEGQTFKFVNGVSIKIESISDAGVVFIET